MSLDAAATPIATADHAAAATTMTRSLRVAETLATLRHHRWPGRATFAARLAHLERLLQQHFDRLPNPPFRPRVALSVRLSLDELASVLPPTEQRLLVHLRARQPLRRLDGPRNDRLQRLLSRIQVYCGSAARHRLMQPYDRPGHDHCLRRHRTLLPRERFRPLRLWMPRGSRPPWVVRPARPVPATRAV